MKVCFVFVLALALALFGDVSAQSPKKSVYDLIIGTYTNKAKSNGIHVYRFDAKTGNMEYRSTTLGITNPSFLTISHDNRNVYSVSEVGRGAAQISAFSFQPESGRLDPLNAVGAGGDGPCYISTDNKGRFAFVAHYGSGSLSAIRLDDKGLLTDDIQIIQHYGSSIDKANQSKPHAHSTLMSPDQRFLLAADLGTDKIHVYKYDVRLSKPLSPASVPFVKTREGAGPRHLTFHPNGKFLYSINELDASITVFDYEDGKLSLKQHTSMLPANFKGGVEAADIHISPDGKYLYGSNRSDGNDIVIFSILTNGTLSYAGRQSALIKTPRNFTIDPSGNFLLVANMDGNNVVVFRRDKKTGLLSPAGKEIKIDQPVCLKFVVSK